MRFMKRKLAMVLAVLLMLPAQPVMAANTLPKSAAEQSAATEVLTNETGDAVSDTEIRVSTESSREEKKAKDEMKTKETSKETENETEKTEETSKEAKTVTEKTEETDKETETGTEKTEETSKEAETVTEKTEETSKETETGTDKTEETSKETEAETEESGKESGLEEETESQPEDESKSQESLVNQVVSAVQKQIQKVAKSEKKKLLDAGLIATPNNLIKDKTSEDEVKFNTGNHVYSVVSRDDFFDKEIGDAYFEEDGSYTIHIPEENPFFPYEVQFTYKGKTVNKWFMDPDDSVEAGGHTFYVSAYFDGTVVTQMSLEVAGETVVVYPEKKEFTDTEEGMIDPASLLPLRSDSFNVDLTGFSPVELTMTSIAKIFTGDNQLSDSDKVIWKPSYGTDKYTISSSDDTIDLSIDTYYGGNSYWEMIVGEDDQLASDNIRYHIRVKTTASRDWIVPTVYKQDAENNRTSLMVLDDTRYYDGGHYDERHMNIYVPYKEVGDADTYVGLAVDASLFENSSYDQLKIYDGYYSDYKKAESEGTDITGQILSQDMTKADAGYLLKRYEDKCITMVAYASGQAVGCLPFELRLYSMGNGISYGAMYEGTGADRRWVSAGNSSKKDDDGYRTVTYSLQEGDAVNKEYYVSFEYRKLGQSSPSSVTAVYAGKYLSIEEATKAGAADIKASLFDQSSGYKADYSNGVYFSIFVGADNSEDQEVYKYCIKTEAYVNTPSDSTYLFITGLLDRDGHQIAWYPVDEDEDTYGGRELTILVSEDTDLTYLKPVFTESPATVHVDKNCIAGDRSSDVVASGVTPLDFSKGPVQFTVYPEDPDSDNKGEYWLQVVKRSVGKGNLYINTLGRESAETSVDSNGVIHSTREMFINSLYDYRHDILLINTGSEALADLDVEVVSDEVELDSYWTLKGKHKLDEFNIDGNIVSTDGKFGNLSNMAKLRFQLKDGVDDGREISGTLTIKSGNKVLMVLNLTGHAGDPGFRTKEIPNAVKYIPYGAAIQANNYYQEWNTTSFELVEDSGKLPEGMELRTRGELYGVPKEIGEFTFTIRMTNSFEEFKDRERTFTLTVMENTDANITTITDEGYEVTTPIQEVALNLMEDRTMVSDGDLSEFKMVFLDGVLLQEGVDYTAESGSTRITIRNQTLKASNKTGVHTLGIEFREGGDPLKQLRASGQNYVVTTRSTSNNNSSNNSSSGSSSSDSDSGSSSQTKKDPKKGYVNTDTGIITGDKAGYSRWLQDENGWKLVYADGTTASGYMTTLENGESVEQIVWEKINGSWYAFGIDGYLKSGWVYDYRLGRWYNLSIDTGMIGGWYKDPVDNNIYYMDPIEGGLSIGWRSIDTKWYYFNSVVTEPSWELNKETNKWQYNAKSKSKPFGALFRNEKTPDGYEVNADGVWIEE